MNNREYEISLAGVLNEGRWQDNRTGVKTLVGRPVHMQFDMADGFPAVSTKKLAFKSVAGEFIALLQGKTSAADFRALGCNYWDQNANENQEWLRSPHREGEDDLGRIYGAQWREWIAVSCPPGATDITVKIVDQVCTALNQIRHEPDSRRIIINGWNTGELDEMSLPPCHVLYQFMVDTERRELSLCLYQRSGDMFLGIPMNIAICGLMLSLFATMTGLRPRHIDHFIAIPHIYETHVEQVREQLKRTGYPAPKLVMRVPLLGMASDYDIIAALNKDTFWLEGYQSHEALKAPMAV